MHSAVTGSDAVVSHIRLELTIFARCFSYLFYFFVSVCLSGCLPAYLPAFLSVCLPVVCLCLSICLPLRLPYLCLIACLSAYLPACLPVCLSVFQPVSLPVCLPVSLSFTYINMHTHLLYTFLCGSPPALSLSHVCNRHVILTTDKSVFIISLVPSPRYATKKSCYSTRVLFVSPYIQVMSLS